MGGRRQVWRGGALRTAYAVCAVCAVCRAGTCREDSVMSHDDLGHAFTELSSRGEGCMRHDGL